MDSILFVCLGNICRSPLAEGIAKKYAKELGLSIHIDSAGTSSWHKGENPCRNSIKIAKQNGVDISSLQSRPVSPKDKKFNLIIAMDSQNRSDLEKMGFKNVKLLGEFGGLNGIDIPDPYYFDGFSGFEKVYRLIEEGIKGIFEDFH